MGVRRLYARATPYPDSAVKAVDHAQTADVVYTAHIDYPPQKLTRYGHTDWRWVQVTFGPTVAIPTGHSVAASSPNTTGYVAKSYSYKITAVKDSAPVQESRASTVVSMTNDLDLSGNYNTITVPAPSGDVSRHIIYKEQGGAYGYIGATDGTSFKDQNIQPILSETPPVGENPFSGAGNYPGAVGLHQQRSVWGATRNVINGTWMSRSADLENMDRSRPARADDALAFAVLAEKVNAITHYVSMDDMISFTTDSTYAIQGGEHGIITPSEINPKRTSGRGARKVKPLVIDTVTFFVPSRGNALRALGFSFEIDGYKSDNVAIFAPHLFNLYGLVKIVYQEEPFSCVWGLRADGTLLCFTWEAEQEVWGWSVIETQGTIEDIETIPEQGYDRLYVLVRRTINGFERLFHERLSLPHIDGIEEANHLDCSLTQQFDVPRKVIPNLWHLEGETVSAIYDGYVEHDLVVEDGKIELPTEASLVSVGLRYSGTLETLPAALTQGSQSSHVNTQQITNIVVRCIDTRGIRIGASGAPLEPVEPKNGENVGELMNVAALDYEVTPAGDWKPSSTVIVQQDEPLPAHIVGIFAGMQGAEE
jgi:hypothetical protein